MTTHLRIAALTSAMAVAASVLAVGLPASAATTTTEPAPGAAGWLAAQFKDSGGLPAVLGAANPDPGFTIDGILALASAGAGGDQAQKAIQWLQEPGVATGFYGSPADPAKLAKLIFGAQVAGVDPTSFGSGSPTDLVALLLPLQDATTGSFTPSTFGQSFAVMALKRAGHGDEADAAAAALLLTQCTNGGWTFDASFDPACQYVDADDTSVAVQALLDAGTKTDAEKAALQKGLDYLTGSQLADHGWSSFDVVGNANSTGLAIQALRAADLTGAADAATTFLRTLQVGCDGPAGEVGAFGYDRNGFDASTALFATAQGILGLGGPAMWQLSIDGADADAPTLVCASPTTATSTTMATSTATGSNAILPVTGSPLTGILVGGGALVVVGAVLLVLGRQRRNRAGV